MADETPQIPLSRREYAIAECLSRGLSNKGVASELGTTDGTIRVYIAHLRYKLQIPIEFSLRYKIGIDFLAGRYRHTTVQDTIERRARASTARSGLYVTRPRVPRPSAPVSATERKRSDDARWDAIYKDRFADPHYYGVRADIRSTLDKA